jgi:hydroxymethylpyrimidine/phosphomethylpyrimidine kinase
MNKRYPCCLTIAGSDSGGNAGIQADLRMFHAYRLHGCTVLSALTAQNPDGVRAVHSPPPAFVAAQLDAVLDAYDVAALKTGLLADPAVIDVVADALARVPDIPKVVDPVAVASCGATLAGRDAADALAARLLPLATVTTPNIPEAELLTGTVIRTPDDMCRAAARLHERYGCAVVVTGGHLAGADMCDVLFDGTRSRTFVSPRIPAPLSTHGTGCSFAAALAAELACGHTLAEAVDGAKSRVRRAIEGAFRLGTSCAVLGWADA